MKKTLMTCLAIAALFAIASSAGAITCTVDQHPAATLLVPTSRRASSGRHSSVGPGARDTLVTIGNASSAPMIAHVNVFNERTELVLDFNIALTGFDVQSVGDGADPRGHPAERRRSRRTCRSRGRLPAQRGAGDELQGLPGHGFIRVDPAVAGDDARQQPGHDVLPDPAWPPEGLRAGPRLARRDHDTHSRFGGVDGIIANPTAGTSSSTTPTTATSPTLRCRPTIPTTRSAWRTTSSAR